MRKIDSAVCRLLVVICIAWCCVDPPIVLSKSKTISESRPPAKNFTKVKVPFGYRLPPAHGHQFRSQEFNLDLFAEKFAQGMAVYAEIYRNPPAEDKKFEEKRFSFA